MRSRWSLVALVPAAIAMHAACVEGIDFIATGASSEGTGASTGSGGQGGSGAASGSTSSSGGSGAASGSGSGGTASSASTTGSSSGSGGCMSPTDCPGFDTLCSHRVCALGMCSTMYEPAGTQVGTAAAGDCTKLECNSSHVAVKVEDTSDPYFDGNECTTDSCNGTTPVNTTITDRTPCPGGVGYCCSSVFCDLTPQGITCRECHPDVDMSCTDMLKPNCQKGKCVPLHCTNGMKDTAPGMEEGGIDCGGPCALCADGAACTVSADCASQVCTGNPKTCQAPTCMDNKINGTETDIDCGGSCVMMNMGKCPDGFGCAFPADCQSGVCLMNVCQMPTCMDGVWNGSETDIDCGGSCSPCP